MPFVLDRKKIIDVVTDQNFGYLAFQSVDKIFDRINNIASQYKNKKDYVEGCSDFYKPLAEIEYMCSNGDLSAEQKGELVSLLNLLLPVCNYKYAEYTKADKDGTAFMIVLNKLDKITDDPVYQDMLLLAMLRVANSASVPAQTADIKRKICRAIVESPTMDIEIKANEARHLHDANVNKNIIKDCEALVAKELDKDIPDVNSVRKYINIVDYLLSRIGNDIPTQDGQKRQEYEQYKKEIKDKFNLEKLLSNGSQYIEQKNQDLETRAIQAEQRVAVAEQQAAQGIAQSNQYDALLEAEKQKNSQLIRQLDEMQQQLDAKSDFIKKIKLELGKIKVSMFGKGNVEEQVQAMQKMIESQNIK